MTILFVTVYCGIEIFPSASGVGKACVTMVVLFASSLLGCSVLSCYKSCLGTGTAISICISANDIWWIVASLLAPSGDQHYTPRLVKMVHGWGLYSKGIGGNKY